MYASIKNISWGITPKNPTLPSSLLIDVGDETNPDVILDMVYARYAYSVANCNIELVPTMIAAQQQAATEILTLANAYGIACALWTNEDAIESLDRESQSLNYPLSDDEKLELSDVLMDRASGIAEESMIQAGWEIFNGIAYSIIVGKMKNPNE